MGEAKVICTLREKRAVGGFSQSQLATQVGVSRQALGAIEAGRQVPSTTLALALARALGCEVEALFRLSGGSRITARLASACAGTRRVCVGRVDGEWVAHPLHATDRAGDGEWEGGEQAGALGSVGLWTEPAQLEAGVLIAGCAPLLGLMASRAQHERHAGRVGGRVRWIPANSSRALAMLAEGSVHAAGVHLASDADPHAHLREARAARPGEAIAIVHVTRWRQGLVVARDNPQRIDVGEGLWRPGLRYAMRSPGAGAQRLLARTLQAAASSAGARRLPAAVAVAVDHQEVAQLVRWGVADLGVAIEGAARAQQLDFVPLAEEDFELVLPQAGLANDAMARAIDSLCAASFRAEASQLPGYSLTRAGEVASHEAA